MTLSSIVLQNFRGYTQQNFDFSPDVTVIIGPNTAGKTNLAEAIHILATGKSFKGATDTSLIHFGKDLGRLKGQVIEPSNKTTLEVVLMSPAYNNGSFGKKYIVNDVPKSRTRFLGTMPLVLFRPEELDIIIDGPGIRREFLDEVLEQIDREYAASISSYAHAIRQRNALLYRAREEGYRQEKQFTYWDELVIHHGNVITKARENFIAWVNGQEKVVLPFRVKYDHSHISVERLLQYKDAEISAGVTLVGPHRDDFSIEIPQNKEFHNVRIFGSRGQQRLVVLGLKLLQIQYMTEKLGTKPLLVLDDIFSELDASHIRLVLDTIVGQQAIITTTHKEFIPKTKLEKYRVIELEEKDS